MENIVILLFQIYMCVCFVYCLEITFTALAKIFDGDITAEDKKLMGNISILMAPVYGSIILFFIPVYQLFMFLDLPIIIRYILWSILISGTEYLWGLFYHKVFNVRPWSYENNKDRIPKTGYTRWLFVPLWGIAGLMLEGYMQVIIKLSKHVYEIILTVVF